MTTSPNPAPTNVNPSRLLSRASGLVAVAVVVLTACSSGEPPSQLPVPAVTWPDSAMAHDREDSPWVQVVREAEVLSSVAWNHLDYSDPDLVAAWGYDTVIDTLLYDAEFRYLPDIYERTPEDIRDLRDWGPNPIVPYLVEETSDGAIVTACAVLGRSLGSGEIASVEIRYYDIRAVEGGTEITYDSTSAPIDEIGFPECVPDHIEEAVFNPVPTVPADAGEGIKYPADRKVYEELQANDS